jgi:hypothetical protein
MLWQCEKTSSNGVAGTTVSKSNLSSPYPSRELVVHRAVGMHGISVEHGSGSIKNL